MSMRKRTRKSLLSNLLLSSLLLNSLHPNSQLLSSNRSSRELLEDLKLLRESPIGKS
jgi:hypothetical protein